MIRLRWLTAHQFRDLEPGVELRFHDGVNLVLGKNGSGKTTLLELISAVLRFNFEPFQNEVFDVEFELETVGPEPVCAMRGRVRGHVPRPRGASAFFASASVSGHQTARVTLTVDGVVVYELVQADGQQRVIVDGEVKATAVAPTVVSFSLLMAGLPDVAPTASAFTLLARVILNMQVKRRFDEALITFHEIVGRTTHETRTPANLILGGGEDENRAHRAYDFVPDSLWDGANTLLKSEPGTLTLMLTHPRLQFLERSVQLFGFQSAQMVLSLLQRRPEGDVIYSDFGAARFIFTRKSGRATITHEQLSYGQKRLLALLYYLEANPDVVVIDELINGLHHAWLEAIMPDILGRQAFLTSQNPLLFDYLEFDSSEQVERAFLLCSVDHETDRMTWRNASSEEANAFLDAYNVGIQHVSEIMRSLGLW